MKILLAEDSGTMRRIQIHMLNALGYGDIVEVDNGEEVAALLRVHPDVGLILLDWNLPLMNGFDCLKLLKADASTKDIPILMVTSEATRERIVEAIQAGASNYLLKPFDAEKFKKAIDVALSSANPPRGQGE